MKIYIASPYTLGDVAVNVRKAIEVADQIIELGHTPFIPHLSHFQHLLFPRPYEDWIRLDNEWIKCCDVLLRLEGESKGADQEVELAKSLGLKIIYNINEISNL